MQLVEIVDLTTSDFLISNLKTISFQIEDF
jgi:hypothetical protein